MGILTVKIALQKFENFYAARERLEKKIKKILRLTYTVLVDKMVRRWPVDGIRREDDA